MNKWLMAALLVAGSIVPVSCDAPAAAQMHAERQQLALAVHVHSSLSTGDLPIDQLVQRAQAVGLDGLVLTENYALGVDYGLWPLRGLLRYRVDYPSVASRGAAAYLETIRDAQARHPEMILIPGLEVVPHYFWSGSLWSGHLTLHNTQKNLLVIGLDRPEAFAALRGRRATTTLAQTALRFWPFLLAAPALWLWRWERVERARTRFYQLTRRRHYRAEAAGVALVAALLLVNNLVLAARPFDPYAPDSPNSDDGPAQRLIDAIRAEGGMTVWSLPEAKDYHRYTMADLAHRGGLLGLIGRSLSGVGGAVTVETDPYPESLERTTGYLGFGAIYQDRIELTAPGGGWDQLLSAYLDGQRHEPVWGFGELAYHAEGRGGKRLSDVQTVVWAESRSASAVLEALKQGTFYARQRTPTRGLVVEEWSLRSATAEAISGATLVAAPQGAVELRLAVSSSDGQPMEVNVNVIRSGELWQRFTATTPLNERWRDEAPAARGRAYYRVEIGEGDQHVVSNPIFLLAAAAAG